MKREDYPRIYTTIVAEHLAKYDQMVFLSGPRQVGKTTIGKQFSSDYLNWDDDEVRRVVMAGQAATTEKYGLSTLTKDDRVVTFDEIHKYGKWKQYIKGFYDTHGKDLHIIVTGSARMDVYKKGGDSMMGRYFPYRVHPFSVAELLDVSLPDENLIRKPRELPADDWRALNEFGGFPDPFLKRDRRFVRRWNTLRFEQMTQSDLRDLTKVMELDQLSAMAEILAHRSGEQLVYKNLGAEVGVDEKTAKKWIKVFKNLYFGFEVRPWFSNIENSIRKTPKWYMRDWAMVEDDGKRAETLIACHLLKAVEGWTDLGFGGFDLYYLRDKQKREVDFLITKSNRPWVLVEVKKSDTSISPSLVFFQKRTQAKHAFQVVLDCDYVDRDCFDFTTPIVVPAKTFLSQLL